MRIKIVIAALAAALILMLAALFLLSDRAEAGEKEPVALPIVMYHDVSRRPSAWGPYVISESELEGDLRWLKAHGYTTVSVQDLLDWEAGRSAMPEKPCMIIFDDGACSTAAYAEPLLEKYGCCAAAAVIGSACSEFSANGEQDPELSNLSWEAAAEMARRGRIEVICHSWDMHRLGRRTGCAPMEGESPEAYRAALTADLCRFRSESDAHGLPLTEAVAFPYGAYTGATTEIVRDLGFSAAFTCEERVNRLTGAEGELLRLGRFNRPHGAEGEKIFQIWEENS